MLPEFSAEGSACIEEIEVGDSVWAYNYETGETELKEVLNVWVKETDEILHVSTSDGETIDTTTNHPFYVDSKGWVAAVDLDIQEILEDVYVNKKAFVDKKDAKELKSIQKENESKG